jgi:hypothetical protein
MNRTALLALWLFGAMQFCEGHPFAPPTLAYVANSDSVYFVRTESSEAGPDSVHPAKVKFSITEVLRGQTQPPLTLLAYEWNPFKTGTEWIIFHNTSGFKNCVGWAMEGDCEWLPIQVTRKGDHLDAEWLGPMDGVVKYLHDHPVKP